MIALQVENLTISGFIKSINTQTFDLEELDQFIRDFFECVENKAISNAGIKLKQLEVIRKAEYNKCLKKEYDDVMEFIDERILERSLYMEKIEKKYKYRGRYGNRKGATQIDQVKKHRQPETPKQLRFMQEGW